MKFSQDFGIKINDEIKNLLDSCIQNEGNAAKLAHAIGTTKTNITTWTGKGKRKGEFITWDKWGSLRKYLISRGLIFDDDPRWMLPSQMRERLMAIRSDGDGTASHSAVNNGTNNGSMTVNNQTTGGSELMKSALRSAVLKSDMCSDCKVKIFTMLETF